VESPLPWATYLDAAVVLKIRCADLAMRRLTMHAEFVGLNSAVLLGLSKLPWGEESGVDGRPIPLHVCSHGSSTIDI